MCSRYSLTSPHEAVRRTFLYRNDEPFQPRYNIAPTQPAAIVRLDARGERELALVRWGLVPSWVKDPREFSLLINARAETVLDKPSFRGGIRHKRCLVPADAFYEWIGPKGGKRPFLIRPKSGGPMAFAGLWDHWLGADGSELDSMAILTVAANADVAAVHDRMPAVLDPRHYDPWLDTKACPAEEAATFLVPAPVGLLEHWEVGPRLGNSRNEGPDLQTPVKSRQLI
jgi:putative SOS response-associated peptidase YedK